MTTTNSVDRERTWPTPEEITSVFDLLEPGLAAIHDLAGPPGGHYAYLVDECEPREDGYWLRAGTPVPSYRDIGVLADFTDRLRFEVEDLAEIIENLGNVFHYARLNGLSDDVKGASDAS
jgi:hypothetical protein